MQVTQIIDFAIVFVPAAFFALATVQFASGLSRLGKCPNPQPICPIAPVEP